MIKGASLASAKATERELQTPVLPDTRLTPERGRHQQLTAVLDFEFAMGGDPNYELAQLDGLYGTRWSNPKPYDYRLHIFLIKVDESRG